MITVLGSLPPRVKILAPLTASTIQKRRVPLYLTSGWRNLISHLLAQRGRRCEACGRTGCRIFGDHIHELKDGGAPLDPGNIRLLCGSCHSAKTARVRAIRTRETPTC